MKPDRQSAPENSRRSEPGPAVDRDAPATPDRGSPESIPSFEILKGRDSINIEHNGRIYQLRRTRQGKLILTK
ncbi:MAG: hemin uptake protein HemP [Casimicrobiaceae bacterium]